MATSTRYFVKGILLKPTTDETSLVDGNLWVHNVQKILKVKLDGAVREVITANQAQTLTNKTIDADANTLSNVRVTNLASGVLDTDISATSASDDTIPSAKAVKTYVDTRIASKDEASEIAYSNATSGLAATNVQTAIDEVNSKQLPRVQLVAGAANKLVANDATGELADVSDITVTTNAFTIASTKHLEINGANDAATTGDDATLASFTAGALRLTNASLNSIANIPAGNNGQLLAILNRTGKTIIVRDNSSALGSAPNRIITGTGGDLSLMQDASLFLSYDAVSAKWQIIGGSGSGGVSFTQSQVAHGFSVLTPIYHNGTTWIKAQANTSTTLATHVVTQVSTDSFTATNFGMVEVNSHGLTVGDFYFVSTTSLGGLTTIEPTTGFSNPVLYVQDSKKVHIMVHRPTLVTTDILDNNFSIKDNLDLTKQIDFNAGGTANTKTTIAAAQTADRVVTLPDVTTTLVGTDAPQTLTNKTITGATIQTPARLDLKQDTKANLTTYALTASNGQLVFATDSKEYFAIKDGLLVDVGGGAGVGSTDLMVADQADKSALTDYTQTGLEIVETPIVLHGTKSFRLQHTTSIKSFKKVMAVDKKFRGKNMTVWVDVSSTATEGNLNIQFRDETNSANIGTSQSISTGSQTITATTANGVATLSGLSSSDFNKLKVGMIVTGSAIPVGTTIISLNTSTLVATMSQNATGVATGIRVSALVAKKIFTFDLPANCSSVSWTISSVVENYAESYLDDIVVQLTSAPTTSATITQTTFNTTDWTAYTPTFSGFTVTSSNFQYRREGSNMYVRGRFSISATNGSTAYASLPNSLTIANSLTTYSILGSGGTARVQPDVVEILGTGGNSYLNICPANASVSGLSLAIGTSFGVADISFTAGPIPIQGWDNTTTTTTTIPLTSSVLVTQPDSYIGLNTSNGYGSTGTKILRFSNIQKSVGSDILYQDSAINGASFTVLKEGTYSFSFGTNQNTTSNLIMGLSINASSLALGITSLSVNEILAVCEINVGNTNRDGLYVSWTGYLNAGDIVRPHTNGVAVNSPADARFSVSYQGSTKIINPSSDQKIAIPTHQLRFEGASSRGTGVQSAVVKFDTQAITQGDAWTIDQSNGTTVTLKKAGKLTVDATVYTPSNQNLAICYNGTGTALTGTADSSYVTESFVNASIATILTTSKTIDVKVGDTIRIICTGTPTARVNNSFSLSLQEQSVAVALQNVTPAWDASDSCIRLQTGNGFGSSSTTYRRFSNTTTSIGTDITYTDSATGGASFKINSEGVYHINYSDISASSTPTLIIFINNAAVTNATISTVTGGAVTSLSPYLYKGDVVNVGSGLPASISSASTGAVVTISKVGKTKGTVDITPFVNVPTIDVQAIEALTGTSTWGSTNTGVPVLNITKNTNNGIIQVISDSVNGTSFKALKDCEIKIASQFSSTNASMVLYLTRNATTLTAATPDGIIGGASTSAVSVTLTGPTESISLVSGDIIRYQRDTASGTHTVSRVMLTATATSSGVATPVQSVSSDTMSFVFQSTALTGNEAVGTFNTYLYNINSNTAVLQPSTPNQSIGSMNTNGIQIFARPFNAAGVSGNPNRVDIVIGKGLKSKQVDAYASAAKVTPIIYDGYIWNANATEAGVAVTYNEVTGILSLDAGNCISSGATARVIDKVTSGTSGYFVFNASKSPSLVTIPNLVQRVAYLSDVKANGTAAGANTGAAYVTRTLNTIVDSTGIVTSLASNQFTLPAGTYNIEASAPAINVGGHRARIRNITDGVTSLLGSSEYATSSTNGETRSFVSGEITITSAKVFELQHFTSTTVASNGFGTSVTSGENEVYAIVKITKIK